MQSQMSGLISGLSYADQLKANRLARLDALKQQKAQQYQSDLNRHMAAVAASQAMQSARLQDAEKAAQQKAEQQGGLQATQSKADRSASGIDDYIKMAKMGNTSAAEDAINKSGMFSVQQGSTVVNTDGSITGMSSEGKQFRISPEQVAKSVGETYKSPEDISLEQESKRARIEQAKAGTISAKALAAEREAKAGKAKKLTKEERKVDMNEARLAIEAAVKEGIIAPTDDAKAIDNIAKALSDGKSIQDAAALAGVEVLPSQSEVKKSAEAPTGLFRLPFAEKILGKNSFSMFGQRTGEITPEEQSIIEKSPSGVPSYWNKQNKGLVSAESTAQLEGTGQVNDVDAKQQSGSEGKKLDSKIIAEYAKKYGNNEKAVREALQADGYLPKQEKTGSGMMKMGGKTVSLESGEITSTEPKKKQKQD